MRVKKKDIIKAQFEDKKQMIINVKGIAYELGYYCDNDGPLYSAWDYENELYFSFESMGSMNEWLKGKNPAPFYRIKFDENIKKWIIRGDQSMLGNMPYKIAGEK